MNTVNMTVFERTGEFGTMRALGNRGVDVFVLILVESTLLGFIGATAGVLLGVLLAWIISAIGIPMPPPPNADIGYTAQIRLVPSVVAGAFAIGFLATVLAAIAPALRVARTQRRRRASPERLIRTSSCHDSATRALSSCRDS